MKRLFTFINLMLLLLVGGVSTAMAADPTLSISMEETHLTPGKFYVININLDNPNKVNVSGIYQWDLSLPKGLEFTTSSNSTSKYKATSRCHDQFLFDTSHQTYNFGNIMRLMMMSGYIDAGTGAIATIEVKCTESLAKTSKIKLTQNPNDKTTPWNIDDSLTVKNAAKYPNIILSMDPNPITLAPSTPVKLHVYLKYNNLYKASDLTKEDYLNGFQFDMTLPEGVSISNYELNSSRLSDSYGLSVVNMQKTQQLSTNKWRMVLFAGFDTKAKIEGYEGEIFSLTLSATDKLPQSGVITVDNEAYSAMDWPESYRPDNDNANFYSPIVIPVTRGAASLTIDENADNDFTDYSGKTVDVKLTRTFKAGNWNTLVLPFDLSTAEVEAAFGSDVKVANFTNSVANTIELNTGDSKEIKANTPVLIKTTADVTNPTFSGRTIVVADPVLKGANGINFVGSYAGSITLAAGDYFISGTNLWRSEGKTTLAATRAYFKTNASTGAKGIKLFIDGVENATTGINAVGTAAAHAGAVYNLNGQKVAESATTRLPAGVYIVNGKKVIIK